MGEGRSVEAGSCLAGNGDRVEDCIFDSSLASMVQVLGNEATKKGGFCSKESMLAGSLLVGRVEEAQTIMPNHYSNDWGLPQEEEQAPSRYAVRVLTFSALLCLVFGSTVLSYFAL